MAPGLQRPLLRLLVLWLGLALLCSVAGERVPGTPGDEQGLGRRAWGPGNPRPGIGVDLGA